MKNPRLAYDLQRVAASPTATPDVYSEDNELSPFLKALKKFGGRLKPAIASPETPPRHETDRSAVDIGQRRAGMLAFTIETNLDEIIDVIGDS